MSVSVQRQLIRHTWVLDHKNSQEVRGSMEMHSWDLWNTLGLTLLELHDCFLTNCTVKSRRRQKWKGPSWASCSCWLHSQFWHLKGAKKEKRFSCLKEGLCQPEAPANTGKIKANISGFCKVQLLIWYVCTNYLYSHCQAHKLKNCYLLTKNNLII